MKKILLTILSAFALSVNAQTAIDKAKTLYQDALTQLENRDGDANQDYSITIEKHKNWPGSGPQTWKTTFYFYWGNDYSEAKDKDVEFSILFFIREKYNWGISNFVEEYTVNDTENVVFYLFVGDFDDDYKDDIPEGAKVENRMYFNDKGAFSSGFRQLRLSDGTTKRLNDFKANDKIVVDRMKYFKTLKQQFKLATAPM